tara:strand:- start:19594 stop:20541 length:948 start_codon:yes stop_codon:yes gene_type:complete
MNENVVSLGKDFSQLFGQDRVRHSVGLSQFTSFGVGGNADWFLDTCSFEEVVKAVQFSYERHLPVTFLGGGTNVLIGEKGIRGLVIRIFRGEISLQKTGVVRASSGVTLNRLIRWMIKRGLGGLEMWAGTPGTVGGGIHGNAHFRGRLIGERLLRVGLVSRAGAERVVDAEALDLSYDKSRLRESGEAILWAEFSCTNASASDLRFNARKSLKFRKQTQPLAYPSAGCIFQNPQQSFDQIPAGIPCSAGALIDKAGLKGSSVGNALVSKVHGNFIVSAGVVKPSEIRELIEECRERVSQKFGITLRDEIIYLGEF